MSLPAEGEGATIPGMRRRPTPYTSLALAVGALTCLLMSADATQASAAGAPKGATPPDRLALNPVGLPIVWRGRLLNYVFVDVRLKLAPGRPVDVLRAKEPYLRDALVRDGYRTPFVAPGDLARIDERALDAALLREAAHILGPGVAVAAEVTGQQPRRRTGLPPPGEAAPPPAGRPIVP